MLVPSVFNHREKPEFAETVSTQADDGAAIESAAAHRARLIRQCLDVIRTGIGQYHGLGLYLLSYAQD